MNKSPAADETKNEELSTGELKQSSRGRIWKFGNLLSERWPEYILEIIVVIIGITISFTINNIQSDAADRRLEQNYLMGLLEDISSDILELEELITETKKVVESGRILLEQSGMNEPTVGKDEFVNHVRTIAGRPNYISKNSTFTALKSSGYFHIIRDNQLLALLFDYEQHYQGLKSVEMAEMYVSATITGPYIIKSIPIADPEKTIELIKNVDVKHILHDIEFVNNLHLRRDNRTELLEGYIETLSVAKRIKNVLEKNTVTP